MASTKLTSRRRFHFLPYRYRSNSLSIVIKSVELDADDVSDEIIGQYKRIDLADYLDWEKLNISGEIEVRKETLKSVIPEENYGSPPIRITLALRAPETHLRKAAWQEVENAGAGKHHFDFEIKRKNYYGKVELKPYLIRTNSQNVSEEYAGHAGARLASSGKWVLIFDKREGVTSGHMEIRYKDFSEILSTKDRSKCLYHLDLEVPSEPILYINKEHEKIREVLDNKGTRGAYARLRDVLFDHISSDVMTKLLLKAIEDLDEDGEVRYDWEDEVLKEFIKEQ